MFGLEVIDAQVKRISLAESLQAKYNPEKSRPSYLVSCFTKIDRRKDIYLVVPPFAEIRSCRSILVKYKELLSQKESLLKKGATLGYEDHLSTLAESIPSETKIDVAIDFMNHEGDNSGLKDFLGSAAVTSKHTGNDFIDYAIKLVNSCPKLTTLCNICSRQEWTALLNKLSEKPNIAVANEELWNMPTAGITSGVHEVIIYILPELLLP